MVIILPIYYEQQFKRKPPKTWLVGDNAYRNWHFFLKNQVKQYYHVLVKEQLDGTKVDGQFTLQVDIYLKNKNSDPSNVTSRMEKFVLDAFQEEGVIVNDTSAYHIGTTWEFRGMDKQDPRCVIKLIPVGPCK
jgi:hypothetical protein